MHIRLNGIWFIVVGSVCCQIILICDVYFLWKLIFLKWNTFETNLNIIADNDTLTTSNTRWIGNSRNCKTVVFPRQFTTLQGTNRNVYMLCIQIKSPGIFWCLYLSTNKVQHSLLFVYTEGDYSLTSLLIKVTHLQKWRSTFENLR